MAKLQIVIADDHTLFRQGLRKILEEKPEWTIVAEAGDGREAIRQVAEMQPDIVILDLSMQLLNGMEAARQIARRSPQTRVLILSMHSEDAYVAQALRAGASGYLLKDSAAQDLITAISAIAEGKSFFSPRVAKVMLDGYLKHLPEQGVGDRYELLSEREREVFQLVAEGRSSKDIAALLSVSPSTIETHRAHVMQKLDLHNTAELVLFAARRGLIT